MLSQIRNIETDVLVIGAGIAGYSAALAAGKTAKTLLVSASKSFAGSSFYPMTWGLGAVAPFDGDEEDMIATIKNIGCQMVDEEVAKTLVYRSHDVLETVNRRVKLLTPSESNAQQKEYIPCFDHTHRFWRGLSHDALKDYFSKKEALENVQVIDHAEVLNILTEDGKASGVLLYIRQNLVVVRAKSIVIASGGAGGLFERKINPMDVLSSVAGMAIVLGVKMVNLEFHQMMLGYKQNDAPVIFNEKVYPYTLFTDQQGQPIEIHEDWLSSRSTHGPFTSRLISKMVDLTLLQSKQAGKIYAQLNPTYLSSSSEFVQHYVHWLSKERGIDPYQRHEVDMYYHASNGGIAISSDGSTQVQGIFACGEATGGMHGADRLGGFSSVNGLVFGEIAGNSAAEAARSIKHVKKIEIQCVWIHQAKEKIEDLQHQFSEFMMVTKQKQHLDRLQNMIESWLNQFVTCDISEKPLEEIRYSMRLQSLCYHALAMVVASSNRKESRGSFYRSDYPTECKEAKLQYIYYDKTKIHSEFVIKK